MKKIIFFVIPFLFILLVVSPHRVFADGEDCSKGYSSTPGQCTNPNETCTAWGQIEALSCLGVNGLFSGRKDYGPLDNGIKCAAPNTPVDCTGLAPYDKLCSSTDIKYQCNCLDAAQAGKDNDNKRSVRDLFLCKPKGTAPLAFSPPPTSGSGIHGMDCKAGPTGDTLYENTNLYVDINPSSFSRLLHYTVAEGSIVLDDLVTAEIPSHFIQTNALIDPGWLRSSTFNLKAGTHTFDIWGFDEKGNANEHCQTKPITVTSGSTTLPACTISAIQPAATSSDGTYPQGTELTVYAKFPNGAGDYQYKLIGIDQLMNNPKAITVKSADGNQTLGTHIYSENATLTIYDKSGSPLCTSIDFVKINSEINGAGGSAISWNDTWAPVDPACTQSTDKSGNTTFTCNTAIGDIKTDASSFVSAMFELVLSISGGIALLLIIISGYRLMFSEGNPEKVKAARDQLISALVGLLFIIFSITILQIIGVNILHIPGFGE